MSIMVRKSRALIIFLSLSWKTSAYSFINKKVLVTGSSGGIGAGIAKELASKGANVLLHYNSRHECVLSTKKHIVDNGGICDGIIQCDFRNPKNICDMMKLVDEIWGTNEIDILVNNAGLITKLAAEDDDDYGSNWMETMQVNINAPYQLSRLAYKRMKAKHTEGVIINVSSIHGSISVEYMTAYAASKSAMDRMTAGLANEWREDKIRVNAVAPGIVPVERTQVALSQQSTQDMWLQHLPSGRMGTVEDIAKAVTFLCESKWMTGTVVTIDGGMTSRSNMPFRPKPPSSGASEFGGKDNMYDCVNQFCTGATYES